MITEIYDRLDAELPEDRWPGRVEVAEDIDLVIARAGQVGSGTAILMPFRDIAGEQALATGGHRQEVELHFLVAIVIRDYSDGFGRARAEAFDLLKADVEQALAGWQPASAIDPCTLVGGESSAHSTGVSIYAQRWVTSRFLTGE